MISVIIATHNRTEKLIRLLDSLSNQNFKNFEVIIVNDFPEAIKLKEYTFPTKIIEAGTSDLWWAESVNVGIRHALKGESKYMLILNDDIIIKNNYLFEAMEFSEIHKNVLQGPLIFDLKNKKKLWAAGGIINWPLRGPIHNFKLSSVNNYTEVDWLPGMGTFFSKSILNKIDLLKSKKHPQYLSDTDFTLSAKSFGFQILVNHNLKLYNETELTGGIVSDKLKFSALKKIFKHKGSPEFISSRISFIKDHTSNLLIFILSLIAHYSKLMLYILKRL